MSKELPILADKKGNRLRLYAGDEANPDRVFTFKKNGVAFDISGFNAVKFIIKGEDAPIADAHVPAFVCPVLVAADGTVNVPFSTLNIERIGEGLIATIYEFTASSKNVIHGEWKVDIKKSNAED